MSKLTLSSGVLAKTLAATSVAALEELVAAQPINDDYVYNPLKPMDGWVEGKLHWVAVGQQLGNAGRIKLGVDPDNRIAERVVNGLESLIELARREELKRDPKAPAPTSPRAAVLRYFKLPRLDEIPKLNDDKKTYKVARDLARKVRVRVVGHKVGARIAERALVFEDDGIGQPGSRLHSTILSLGGDNKVKDPYLIGMWGQGGSSALAASQLTWIVSRRAPHLGDAEDGVAWTVVKEIFPTDRRGSYYAYLAATPEGEVASIDAAAADALDFAHGTRIGHVHFDLGPLDPMKLYQALNNVLPNPVLPFQINTKTDGSWDPCWGIGYALSKRSVEKTTSLDKPFNDLPIVMSKEHD